MFIFLKTQKNIKIQNFEPQKMDRAYVCMKISEYPPWATNESQEVSPFPAGDHKAHINRCVQRHSKHKTEKHKRSTKEVPPWNGQKSE